MSAGASDQITPRGLHGLMFSKTFQEVVNEELGLALHCERECETAGEATELQTQTIQRHLRAVRDAIYERCCAEIAREPDLRKLAAPI